MWDALSLLVRKSGRRTLRLLNELARSGYSMAEVQSLLREINRAGIRSRDVRILAKERRKKSKENPSLRNGERAEAVADASRHSCPMADGSSGEQRSTIQDATTAPPQPPSRADVTTIPASVGVSGATFPVASDLLSAIDTVPVESLAQAFPQCALPPPTRSKRSFSVWQMEIDDAPIFSWLYRAHQPKRHLEFGTWQGFGACLCLDACDATVWTLNLPDGETRPDGTWAYGHQLGKDEACPQGAVVLAFGSDSPDAVTYVRTDAGGSIGRLYRERGLGQRVCQIYCDSRLWDATAYPPDFFDSALVDGGHDADVVVSDSRKALSVLRPGGLILWHDFCPDDAIATQSAATAGVLRGVFNLLPELKGQLSSLFWIEPSFILAGLKK